MKLFSRISSESGVALTLVMIGLTVAIMLAGSAMMLAQNQRSIIGSNVNDRTKAFYQAQAGNVDAQWRLEHDQADAIGGVFSGQTFTDKNWDPPPYYLDLNQDEVRDFRKSTSDIEIDISAVDATTGLRRIVCKSGQ